MQVFEVTLDVTHGLLTKCVQNNVTLQQKHNATVLYEQTKNWKVFYPVGQTDEPISLDRIPFCFPFLPLCIGGYNSREEAAL